MVTVFGAWIVLWVLADVAVSAASHALFGIHGLPPLWLAGEFLLSTLSYAVLIASVFRTLPDLWMAWADLLKGALFTAFLLAIGTQLIGAYMGYASPASAYGAAGTMVVLLLWLYYTLQIFVLGAELTGVYAKSRGGGIKPHAYAHRLVEQRPTMPEGAP
jgi:membrane protein